MEYDLLINKDNKLNEEYYKNIVLPSLIEVIYERDNDIIFETFGNKERKIYLEKETSQQWIELKKFINKNYHIKFDICSGFLTIKEQQYKYNEYLKRNGMEMTKNSIALPYYSEHHTGLAIDCDYYYDNDWAGICPNENGTENEITYWIHSILHNYGFILRYPKLKQQITNMKYEPWHIRYVGKELAKNLYENNLTLEEYTLIKNDLKNNIVK